MKQGDAGKVVRAPWGLGWLMPPQPKLLLGVSPLGWTRASGKEQPRAGPHGCVHFTCGAVWAVPCLYRRTRPLLLPPQSRHSPACWGADSKLARGPALQVSVHPASQTAGLDSPTLPSTGLVKGCVSPPASPTSVDTKSLFSCPFPACAQRQSKRESGRTRRERGGCLATAQWQTHASVLLLRAASPWG